MTYAWFPELVETPISPQSSKEPEPNWFKNNSSFVEETLCGLGCYVGSWAAPSPETSLTPYQIWGLFPPSHSLPVAGASACRCVGCSLCLGLGPQVYAGSVLVAAWQRLGSLALPGLSWKVVCHWFLVLWALDLLQQS
ncbi:hypothetical protein AMECASPLE_017986 [Ameca splendens]|uniref:Uncharacterized protein n=1 Tax=Ameca splendens TaxID=208324 RepID=A0ABV0Z1H2_9TELE